MTRWATALVAKPSGRTGQNRRVGSFARFIGTKSGGSSGSRTNPLRFG